MERIRRVRGDGWYADVPDAATRWLVGEVALQIHPGCEDAHPTGRGVFMRGNVLDATSQRTIFSCGGLLVQVDRECDPRWHAQGVRILLTN